VERLAALSPTDVCDVAAARLTLEKSVLLVLGDAAAMGPDLGGSAGAVALWHRRTR
jgi:hypothetical protein